MFTAKWTVVSTAGLLLLVILLWLFIGFWPQRVCSSLTEAAAYGESFGCVNSLFAGVAFAFVALALILQMRQISDNARTQAEQGRLQSEQVRIAERTTRIQEAIWLDARRRVAMDAFLKTSRDTATFKHAFLAWHPANNPSIGPHIANQEEQALARRLKKEFFDAYTALRSNCLSIGLIFDKQGDTLDRAIQDLYVMTSGWFPTPPTATECEEKLNQQIQLVEQTMKPLWELLSTLATGSR